MHCEGVNNPKIHHQMVHIDYKKENLCCTNSPFLSHISCLKYRDYIITGKMSYTHTPPPTAPLTPPHRIWSWTAGVVVDEKINMTSSLINQTDLTSFNTFLWFFCLFNFHLHILPHDKDLFEKPSHTWVSIKLRAFTRRRIGNKLICTSDSAAVQRRN